MITKWLSHLKPNEEMVIRLRFGLNGCIPCSLEEIGIKRSITRERVRQIENKALEKLKRVARYSNTVKI